MSKGGRLKLRDHALSLTLIDLFRHMGDLNISCFRMGLTGLLLSALSVPPLRGCLRRRLQLAAGISSNE